MTAYMLPSVLDTAAAPALRLELLHRLESRQPLRLDGSDVARLGQACLQILASARASAENAGLSFALTNPSELLSNMTSLAGLNAALDSVD